MRHPAFAFRPLFLAVLMATNGHVAAQTSRAGTTGATQALSIEIPARPAAQALRDFLRQADFQLIYSPDLLRGINTNAVSGVMTPRQALARMLEGTGVLIVDTGPNAATLRSASAPAPARSAAGGMAGMNSSNSFVSPEAAAMQAATALDTAAGEDASVRTLQDVTVTGSRLRSIVGEQGANPVLVFTRDDIDRAGVTSFAELRNLIPQLSVGASAINDGTANDANPQNRLLFDLRGMTPGNTLVLVDGLRLPRTSQNSVAEAYEATGIPLSAIERVEVLLGGGSAIYGADAVGGVVNIITRKNYVGTTIEYSRDNTFEDDTAQDALSISHSLRKGGLIARASLSHEQQNALARRDRDFLDVADPTISNACGTSTTNIYPVFGRVCNVANANLPGTTSRYAYIPPVSDGTGLTRADFANAAPSAAYDVDDFLNSRNESKNTSASVHLEYEFNEYAVPYLDASYSQSSSWAPVGPLRVNAILPASNPNNPFGVPIRVQKYVWEYGLPKTSYEMSQQTVTAGVRGSLPHDWRYNAYVGDARSKPDLRNQNTPMISDSALNAAIASATPPILLNDGTSNDPNGAEFWRSVLQTNYFVTERPVVQTAQAAFDGPLFDLPAGSVNLAVGAEFRREKVSYTSNSPVLPGAEAPVFVGLAASEYSRDVNAQFAEVSVPVFASAQEIAGLHTLTFTAAARRDDYADFGDAIKPSLGMLFKPVEWISLRASKNKAFRVPYLADLYRPRTTSNVPGLPASQLTDPYRGNRQGVSTSIALTTGGNPDLRPENSEHLNYGILLESPFANRWVKGLSLSVDRFESVLFDRVGGLNYQQLLDFFPESFTRAELTDADRAAGYTAGVITGIENTVRNVSRFKTAGFDYALRYVLDTDVGMFTLDARATSTDKYYTFLTPAAGPSRTQSPLLRPTREVGMFSWTHQGLGASVTYVHQAGFPVSLSNVTGLPNEAYPSTHYYSSNVWYDFGNGSWHDQDGWLGRWTKGTRVSLGFINIGDEEPSVSPSGARNGSIDPRGRRYTITLRKSF